LKEHFEPFLRASSLSSSVSSSSAAVPSSAAHSHHLHSSSITAAASAALARDVPGVSKYNPLGRSTSGRSTKDRSVNKDEMTEYKSRLDISTASKLGGGGGEVDVEYMRHLETVGEVASLEQRWTSSWAMPLQTQYVNSPYVSLYAFRD
jgi:dynactin-4